jgi:glycosyltransferase involved in cell wall biosynthesis
MLKFPKISCLTVTKNRFDLLKKSIYCYTQQTYKNKELVIISQSDSKVNLQIRNHIDLLNRNDIVFVEAPARLSLGAMRNLSIEVATGSILCQWDDDDLYHPQRVMAQYRALLGKDVVATLYTQHLKLFLDSGKMYWCDWSVEKPQWRTMLCGSIMFHKEMFYTFNNHLYPECGGQSDKEEDMNVLIKFSRIGKLAPVNYGYHYIYVFHGRNVYDLNHHRLVLEKRVIGEHELRDKQDLLTNTFDLVQLEQSVKMCSLDDVAFEYTPIQKL